MQRFTTLMAAVLLFGACDREAEGEGSSETATGTETATTTETGVGGPVGTFEIGWGEFAFEPVVDGGELHIVWGSQGAAMYPMPVRGSEFFLAPDPKDFTDERTPMLGLELDVDGIEPGLCGHFKCIYNYPITFDILPDGSYEFVYVRVIVSDGIDPSTLHGRAAHLWVELDPWDSDPHVVEYDFTMNVDPPPN